MTRSTSPTISDIQPRCWTRYSPCAPRTKGRRTSPASTSRRSIERYVEDCGCAHFDGPSDLRCRRNGVRRVLGDLAKPIAEGLRRHEDTAADAHGRKLAPADETPNSLAADSEERRHFVDAQRSTASPVDVNNRLRRSSSFLHRVSYEGARSPTILGVDGTVDLNCNGLNEKRCEDATSTSPPRRGGRRPRDSCPKLLEPGGGRVAQALRRSHTFV